MLLKSTTIDYTINIYKPTIELLELSNKFAWGAYNQSISKHLARKSV